MTLKRRKDIQAALDTVPLASVLQGAVKAKEKRLTAKQVAFARSLALGNSKAQAYRDAYDTKGQPITQSRRGQELAKDSAVAAQVDAFRLAAEAERHRTPAALRSLVIERLTRHAIDDDIAPAQRLRALELLGKVTEVAAFTERREVVSVSDPGRARAALLDSLRSALRADAVDAVPVLEASQLPDNVADAGQLGERSGPAIYLDGNAESVQGPPPGRLASDRDAQGRAPAPPRSAAPAPAPLHSNLHTDSPIFSDPPLSIFPDEPSNTVTEAPPLANGKFDG